MSQGENQITVAVLPRCNGIDSPLIPNRFARCSFRFIGFRLSRTFSLFIFRHFGGFYFIYGQINFFRRKRKTKSRKEKVPPVFLSRCYPRTINFSETCVSGSQRHVTWRLTRCQKTTIHFPFVARLLDGNKRGRRKVLLWKSKKKISGFFPSSGGLNRSITTQTHTHTPKWISISPTRNPWRQHDN